jgi:hypothetical protein
MRTLIEILAGLAILANAVIYGTDVFGAIIQRPAVAAVDDRTLTQVMVSIGGLIAAAVTAALAAATGHWVSTAAAGLAALALITFAVVYTRVSKPVNTALTAAAVANRVPDNARELQARWDSVINGRVALQTLALAALCVGLAAA